MQHVPSRYVTAVALIIYGLLPYVCFSTTIPAVPRTTAAPSPDSTCEFRTINYITDTLPQYCLKSLWSPSNGTSFAESVVATGEVVASAGGNGPVAAVTAQPIESKHDSETSPTAAPTSELTSSSTTATATATTESKVAGDGETATADTEAGELNDASFLSFEEWKKQALEKAGQKGLDIGIKKSLVGVDEKKRESESIHNHLDSLGDDGEIELDFGGFGRGANGAVPTQHITSTEADVQHEEVGSEVGPTRQRDQYRSKDAGKTCKERFSYASFDAGATILKTHPGAKNAKAVLVENKDSYMLSECAAGNKFLIIELSEDIWIDTLVLANYEFFSSMIRTFRVSVSDRYPVKIDKWKDAGTYEARNSREIQAFLVENPQIWARYIRIEFLSHYGNEYYCPLSLVRVHGTRMLEFWKETEAANEEDEVEGLDGPGSEEYVPDVVAEVVREGARSSAERKTLTTSAFDSANTTQASAQCRDGISCMPDGAAAGNSTSPWSSGGHQLSSPDQAYGVCWVSEAPSTQTVQASTTQDAILNTKPQSSSQTASETHFSTTNVTAASNTTSTPQQSTPATIAAAYQSMGNVTTGTQRAINETSHVNDTNASSIVTEASKSPDNTGWHKNKTTSSTSSSIASPTQQESFFKAVTRRLQLLEANSTLSLKYIEEQSRILRDAFSKVEKKQLQKTTSFLQTLNTTVLSELQGFRQQYDEIWQSTVISLQSQREESQREILAISSRLNILADEVVFQKRMSIIQAIILLLCLGLVVFSRVSASGNSQLELSTLQRRIRTLSEYPNETPVHNYPYVTREANYSRDYLSTKHHRQESDESGDMLLRDADGAYSPVTPVSNYEGSDYTTTPISMTSPNGHLRRRVLERSSSEQSPPRIYTYSSGSDSNDPNTHALQPSSPTRTATSSKRKQLPSPPSSAMSPQPETSVGSVSNLSTWEDQIERQGQRSGTPDGSSFMDIPSLLVARVKQEMLIARKPLPALPREDKEGKDEVEEN